MRGLNRIILIEGPRGSGKSHLVDNFMLQNEDPNVLYYKFAFSDWIQKLKIKDLERGPGVHYFSISNIITILDVAQKLLVGKTIVLDRSIFSAYVWSIYRDRLDTDRLIREFSRFLGDLSYCNCKVVYVHKEDPEVSIDRDKEDIFDEFEDYEKEKLLYDNIFHLFNMEISDSNRGNEYIEFKNTFDSNSEVEFNKLLRNLIDK